MSELGKLIRERRKALGLSQLALTQRMEAAGRGVTRSFISQVELGIVRIPEPSTVQALAVALDIPPAALMTAAGFPADPDVDAGFSILRRSYEQMDEIRRRELVALAGALLQAQRHMSG